MYNEHRSANRSDWKYAYKGAELLPYARKKLEYHSEQENAARREAAALLTDPTVQRNSEAVKRAEQAITEHGDAAEKCKVWVHQFQRESDRDFQLALGDVVYFGLVDGISPVA